MKPFIYIASPYAHPDPAVMDSRCQYAAAVACVLLRVGYPVFCPLSHSHPIKALDTEGQISHEMWLEADFRILPYCDILAILALPGWKESKGVTQEANYCQEVEKLTVLVPVGVPTLSADAIVRFAEQHYTPPVKH